MPRFPGAPGFFYETLRAELIAHAEHTFKLDQGAGDGASIREHLEARQERMRRRDPGYTDPELEKLDAEPEMPKAGDYLMAWFGELSATRGLVPFTQPLPDGRMLYTFRHLALSPSDIESWCRQSRISLSPWEFKILLALDRAFLSAMASKS